LRVTRELGDRVETVWSGQEALDLLADRPVTSSILMECQMPLLDGYEIVHKISSNETYRRIKSISIIALTASAIKVDREKCEEAGMNDYLSKPFSQDVLEEMLRKWLSSRVGD